MKNPVDHAPLQNQGAEDLWERLCGHPEDEELDENADPDINGPGMSCMDWVDGFIGNAILIATAYLGFIFFWLFQLACEEILAQKLAVDGVFQCTAAGECCPMPPDLTTYSRVEHLHGLCAAYVSFNMNAFVKVLYAVVKIIANVLEFLFSDEIIVE